MLQIDNWQQVDLWVKLCLWWNFKKSEVFFSFWKWKYFHLIDEAATSQQWPMEEGKTIQIDIIKMLCILTSFQVLSASASCPNFFLWLFWAFFILFNRFSFFSSEKKKKVKKWRSVFLVTPKSLLTPKRRSTLRMDDKF